jgi:hypothetical protein
MVEQMQEVLDRRYAEHGEQDERRRDQRESDPCGCTDS